MSNLEDHLANLKPDGAILKLVRAAAAQRALESGRIRDYVSLRPPGQMIATYVHRNRVSIVMDPTAAERAQREIVGARLDKGMFLIAPQDIVSHHHAEVLEVMLEAIDWRAAGGRGRATGQRPPRKGVPERDFCPECWTEFTALGTCICPENL